jgi:hypothetical protein
MINMPQQHHPFGFEHGEILSHIGAAWYASYAYYMHVDNEHRNYTNVSTGWRIPGYQKNLELEKYFIKRITQMSPAKLNTNKIGLSGEEVVRMARAVLAKLSEQHV